MGKTSDLINYFSHDRFYRDIEFYDEKRKNNYLTDIISRQGSRWRAIISYKMKVYVFGNIFLSNFDIFLITFWNIFFGHIYFGLMYLTMTLFQLLT